MPLSDNLIVKVQPAASDTFVKNLIDNSDVAASGSGTLTLQNDAGLYGWQVQGARNGTFAGGISYEGGAITVAARFKANSRAADFAQYLGVFTTSTGGYGAQITNNGSGTGALRLREAISGGGFTVIGSPSYTTGNYFTVVLRLRDNSYSTGTLDAFLKQVGRSSNNPDHSVAASTAIRTGTVDDLVLGASSQNLTYTDILVWARDLTDAEAASVADDIRGVFGVGDPTGTISWTEANDTAAGSGSLSVSGSSATTEANDTAAGTGTVGDVVAGNVAFTEADDATSAAGALAVSGSSATTEANDTASASGTVSAAGGTFITEPIMNNTETILANQAVVWSWLPGGRIGTLDTVTAVDGTGTTASDGTLTVTGLSAGAGILMVAVQATDATDDYVYYEAGTVS